LSVHLRIFLSSPGDVVEERQLARVAIAELQREPQFEGARLEAVSWDDPQGRPPLVAQYDPQTAVERGLPKPSECNAVVGIFWARMGSPLPTEKWRKSDGTAYLSGTEYELEDAFAANPGPDVLLYRRSEEPEWGARDPDWQQKQDQLTRLDTYLELLKAAPRYIDTYGAPSELKDRLKNDLRKVLAPRLHPAPIADTFQQAAPAEVGDERRARAEARLAQLPTDAVPPPASLPPGSHMPLARNALFVGRQEDLKALAIALNAGGTAAVGQLATVTGLGGIGKTQLASEFVHRYGQYLAGGAFWLSFADPAAVPAEIATCGGAGGMKLQGDFGRLPLEEQVALVAAEWQGALPRLLVFDNCEDEALLAQWRPRAGGCRVLVTSRRDTWSPHLGIQEVSLGVLSRSENVALLRKHRPDLAADDPILNAIAAELGDLPLALHLAGSFLARYRRAPAGEPAVYLEAVRRPDLLDHRSLAVEGQSPTGHEQHVARTFALSYDQLRPADAVDQMALVTLARAAWFAPGEPIPRTLLAASAGVDGADEPAILRFEDGLARLRELGLIAEREDGALVLHRLLAAFVRAEAGDPDTHRRQVEASLFAEAARLNQAGYPAPLLAWQPQLRFVAERAAETGSGHAGRLLHELAYHLKAMAQLTAAKSAYELALASFERVLRPDHPDIVHTVNSLGTTLHELGDLHCAKAAYVRSLAMHELHFGPNHPKIAVPLNNLGKVLHDLGDSAGARAAYERALEIDEKASAPTTRRSPSASTIWARCSKTWAISRAPGTPSTGRWRFSRSTSGVSTPM
jgi:tetratricopeptide (TPR) repeat protein